MVGTAPCWLSASCLRRTDQWLSRRRPPARRASSPISLGDVVVQPGPGAQPQAALPNGAESSTLSELPQVIRRVVTLRGESSERDQLGFPRELGDQESTQGPCDGASDNFCQGVGVASIGYLKRSQIPAPLGGEDDGRRIASLDQHKVKNQPADAPVSVNERMNALEPCMVRCGVCDWMAKDGPSGDGPCAEVSGNSRRQRDADPSDGHSTGPPVARPLAGYRRLNSPGQLDDSTVDLSDYLERNPVVFDCLPVHPVGGSRVSLNLQSFHEPGVRLSAFNNILDLSASHRVALDCSGVVHVVKPDSSEDVVSLYRPREAT